MLQQWRKPHTLVISPEGVSVKIGKQVNSLSAISKNKVTNASWQQVLNDFELQASNLTSQTIKVIISNHYVRYAVLPWQADVYLDKDWRSLAENYLRKLYGNVVDTWLIKIALQGYGHPIIISAIDKALLSHLEMLASQYAWSIDTVEPAFLSVIDYFSNQLSKQSSVAMIENKRIVLAQIEKNAVVHFSVISPPENEQNQEIDNLINRSLKLQPSAENATVYIISEQYIPELSGQNLNIVNLLHNKEIGGQSSMAMKLAELL